MIEIWKDVPGYEGKYMVSNLGQIKSLNYNGTEREVILKPQKRTESGYRSVNLYDYNGKQKTHNIHRIVAEVFVPNPNNYTIVNHKDCNTANCSADNLEWCTQSYNCKYADSQRKRSENAKRNGGWGKAIEAHKRKVKQFDLDGVLVKVWDSMSEAARSFKLKSCANIQACCVGKQKTSQGYKWEYYGE